MATNEESWKLYKAILYREKAIKKLKKINIDNCPSPVLIVVFPMMVIFLQVTTAVQIVLQILSGS